MWDAHRGEENRRGSFAGNRKSGEGQEGNRKGGECAPNERVNVSVHGEGDNRPAQGKGENDGKNKKGFVHLVQIS